MPRPAKDFTGERKGYLTVLERVGTKGTAPLWRVRCDCGNVVDMPSPMIYGATKSCGCKRWEATAAAKTKHGKGRKGANRSRVYKIWAGMKARCEKPYSPRYNRYGGRGITYCDAWKTFDGFYADMGDPPSDKHTLDRIDNDGNYEPGNCRWATPEVQVANKSGGLNEEAVREIRSNPHLKLKELAARFNVTESCISGVRLRKTWKHIA